MTKAERLKFMRERFKIPRSFPPPRKRQYVVTHAGNHYRQGILSVAVDQHTREMQSQWVYMPRKEPVLRVAHKRKARVSPLTKIADQLPHKLPRIR